MESLCYRENEVCGVVVDHPRMPVFCPATPVVGRIFQDNSVVEPKRRDNKQKEEAFMAGDGQLRD